MSRVSRMSPLLAGPAATFEQPFEMQGEGFAHGDEAALDAFAGLYASHIKAEGDIAYPAAEVAEVRPPGRGSRRDPFA